MTAAFVFNGVNVNHRYKGWLTVFKCDMKKALYNINIQSSFTVKLEIFYTARSFAWCSIENISFIVQ